MRPATSHDTAGTILLVGASRGLGQAMAAEFLKKGWNVVGTVRGSARTKLHDLADEHEGRIEIKTLDMTEPDQIGALHDNLFGRRFDILFVNAGTANNQNETVADVSTEEFVRVMVTNALSPMRVVENLQDLVSANGLTSICAATPPAMPESRARWCCWRRAGSAPTWVGRPRRTASRKAFRRS